MSEHDDIQQLLGAYALDAVDADERDLVDAHLSTCPRCQAEVADHREVAALLAYSGAAAPDGLWDRLAGELDEGGEAPPPPRLLQAASKSAASRPARRWRGRAAGALLAAAAVVIVALGVQVREQDRRLDDLSSALATDALERAFETAAASPGAQQVVLRGEPGSVPAVIRADGTGFLRAGDLPPLPEGLTYQLWGLRDEHVVSLGVIGPDPDIVAFEAWPGYGVLAITAEQEPGVASPALPPVVAGELSA